MGDLVGAYPAGTAFFLIAGLVAFDGSEPSLKSENPSRELRA